MRKINRLKLALKTGAFWSMFKPAPVAADITPNREECEAKCRKLWEKYTEAKRKVLNGEIWVEPDSPLSPRFDALYQAHLRDLRRLLKRYDPDR
jgi:hypothetical protein